jgi:hypothetical protein
MYVPTAHTSVLEIAATSCNMLRSLTSKLGEIDHPTAQTVGVAVAIGVWHDSTYRSISEWHWNTFEPVYPTVWACPAAVTLLVAVSAVATPINTNKPRNKAAIASSFPRNSAPLRMSVTALLLGFDVGEGLSPTVYWSYP